jgi:flagellar FliL protein
MADEEKTAEPAAAEAKPAGGGKGKLIVIAVVVLALGGGGFAAWELGLVGGHGGDQAEAKEQEPGGHAGARGAPRPGALEPLDPFVANLSDEDGRRYLKATLQVEFFDPSVPSDYHDRMPQARDMLLTLFSSKTFAEVRTPQGKAVLRDEIVNRLNTVMNRDAVKAVYFTEFIVQ